MATKTIFAMTLAVAAGGGLASQSAQAAEAVVVYTAGIDGWLDDPKDAALHRALVLMERYGLSLPPDMDEEDVLGTNLLVDALLSEIDFRVSLDRAAAPHVMPVSLSVTSRGNDGASVDDLMDQITKAMKMTGAPESKPDPDGGSLSVIQGSDHDPPVWFGVEDGRLAVGINGKPETAPLDWSACGLPDGTAPLFGFKVDFQELGPLLGMAAMFNPQAAGMLSNWGLTGPDAMSIDFAMGRSGGVMHMGGQVTNYRKHYGEDLVPGGIRAADLAVIPEDAVDLQVSRYNLSRFLNNMLEMADTMTPPQGTGPDGQPLRPSEMARQQAQAMLGIDPKTQFIDYLGDTLTVYRANSTGGDGLMSFVMLVELSNPEAMATSLGSLAARINAMAAPMSRGYVQLSSWSHPDCGDVISLVFPGLPIPIEVSWVVKGDWMVATLTPQAMVAACRQIGEDTSIQNNPQFRTAVGADAIGAIQVNYTDVPAQLAGGYGITSALMAAVSNYTRPRRNTQEGVPLVFPTYRELAQDALPCTLIASLDGDDLIYTGHADPSVSVLATGAVANISAMLPLVAPLAAGMAMPAISSARESAKLAHGNAQLRGLAMAASAYHANHGAWPESLDELVAESYVLPDSIHDLGGGQYRSVQYLRPSAGAAPSEIMLYAESVDPSKKAIVAHVDGSIHTSWHVPDHNH